MSKNIENGVYVEVGSEMESLWLQYWCFAYGLYFIDEGRARWKPDARNFLFCKEHSSNGEERGLAIIQVDKKKKLKTMKPKELIDLIKFMRLKSDNYDFTA